VAEYFLLGDKNKVLSARQLQQESDQRIVLCTNDRKHTEQILNGLVPGEYRYDEEEDRFVITSCMLEEEQLHKKLKVAGINVKELVRSGQNIREVLGKYELQK